jgi:hypothetical protein
MGLGGLSGGKGMEGLGGVRRYGVLRLRAVRSAQDDRVVGGENGRSLREREAGSSPSTSSGSE